MKRLLLLLALAGAIAAVAIPTASTAVRVLPLSAHPNGWNYDQWHTNYIRRALQKDLRSLHSLFAIRNGTCGQKVGQARAWLLPTSVIGSLSATCRIRPGTRLALTTGGIFSLYAGPEKLNSDIDRVWSDLVSTSLSVDGVSLRPHLLRTPFAHARMPFYNAQIFGVSKTLVSFIARDYFALLSPLSPGRHTVTTSVTFRNPDETFTMTLRLNVR